MLFGLRNAPSTFQRMMDRFKISLARINLLVYLDDIIIRSSSFEQRLHDVKTVLEKLGEYNLRVTRSKCRFACTSIQYLGHLITPLGIVTDPKKTEALSNLPPPTNVKQLLSFIQACSWYRRFIPKFAEIAKPLTDLTKKNAVWTWGQAEKDAWNELRQRLITSPILKQAEESIIHSENRRQCLCYWRCPNPGGGDTLLSMPADCFLLQKGITQQPRERLFL